MNTKTIFNYTVSFYLIRIYTLVVLADMAYRFSVYSARPDILYKPSVFLQSWIFPEFPSPQLYYSIIIVTAIVLITSLFIQKPVITFMIFILLAICNLPVYFYHSGRHITHLLLLSYFLSIFLQPHSLQSKHSKYISWYYFGLLITYSWSGMYKWGSMILDFITHNPRRAWYECYALEINTWVNYFYADRLPPQWMQHLLEYPTIGVIISFVGISLQALCFLGAFNRKLLTFFMVYLVLFHVFTEKFVLADFYIAQITLIIVFFPYAIFQSYSTSSQKT